MAAFTDARDRWNQRYRGSDDMLFGDAPNRWLADSEPLLGHRSAVLCVADGDGRNGVWLAGKGHAVTAFDLSEVAVGKARAFATRRGVAMDVSVAGLDDWPWLPEAFDAVVAVYVQFAPPESRRLMFEGIARTLRPGGVLVVEGFGPRQLGYRSGGPGIAEHLYTLPLLTASFAGWSILASRDADLELAEGAGHAGRAHVVSLTARKPG